MYACLKEYWIPPLLSAHTDIRFSLCSALFRCLSLSSLCPCRLCHIVLGPLQSRPCLTRGLPPFRRCVDGASLCIPHSVPFTPSLFSPSLHKPTMCETLCLPSFSNPSFLLFTVSLLFGRMQNSQTTCERISTAPYQHFPWFTLCNITLILLYTHYFEVL